MMLPGVYRGPVDYVVGLYVAGRVHRRWLVRLRLPDGGYVDIAEYRTLIGATRLVKRSWKLAA
jgi:hypothetical protein